MTSYEPDDITINRVRKLLRKAEATDHPHEAEAFSRKAAELIARHRIDADLLVATAERDAPELVVSDIELGRGAYVRARLALLSAIAHAHDAEVVFSAGPTGTVAHVAGYSTDIAMIQLLYNSLLMQAAREVGSIRSDTPASTLRFRRSFLFGFAERLGDLLRESRRVVEAEAGVFRDEGGSQTPAALATVERRQRVQDYASVTFGRVRRARAASNAEARGWNAGASAAARADIGRTRIAGTVAIGRGSG